jgi:hypothetical protein
LEDTPGGQLIHSATLLNCLDCGAGAATKSRSGLDRYFYIMRDAGAAFK